MTTKKKYTLIIAFLFCIVAIIGTMYFFRPLSANDVFYNLDSVNKVVFNVRFDEKKESVFVKMDINESQMEYFKNLLEMSEYRRVYGETNIQSQSNAYDILFNYKSNNYSVLINDKGYIVVEDMNGERKYKILSSKNNVLFMLIDEMVMSK